MCFSAMVWADYRKYVRQYGARIDIHEFIRLFELRAAGEKLAIPRAVSNAFMQEAGTDEERYCQELIDQFEAAEVGRIQADLFQQRHRLADAERALLAKTTKKASEDKRIAGNKVAAAVAKLKELQLPHSVIEETRIFSGAYCPVMVMNDAGEYVVRPMRYLCRPPGMPPESERKYPGMYNARRSSLEVSGSRCMAATTPYSSPVHSLKTSTGTGLRADSSPQGNKRKTSCCASRRTAGT